MAGGKRQTESTLVEVDATCGLVTVDDRASEFNGQIQQSEQQTERVLYVIMANTAVHGIPINEVRSSKSV